MWKTNDAGRTWNPIFRFAGHCVDWGDCGGAFGCECDLRGIGRSGHALVHFVREWDVQVHGCGKNVGAHRAGRFAADWADPGGPATMRTRFLWRRWGMRTGRTRSAEFFVRKTAGKSWQKILFNDENTGAIDLAIEPGNPKTIYAAMWQTRRPPWSIYAPSNGPGSGLYRSNDGGEHWEQLTGHGLPSEGSRADGDCVRAEQSEADLFDCGCEGGRAVPLRRRRGELAARFEGPADLATGMVFLRSERRSEGSGHGVRAEHGELPVAGRRENIYGDSRERRAGTIITNCGSIPTSRSE